MSARANILSARVPHGRGERPSSPPNAGPLATYAERNRRNDNAPIGMTGCIRAARVGRTGRTVHRYAGSDNPQEARGRSRWKPGTDFRQAAVRGGCDAYHIGTDHKNGQVYGAIGSRPVEAKSPNATPWRVIHGNLFRAVELWSARQAHNLEVAGSIPARATKSVSGRFSGRDRQQVHPRAAFLAFQRGYLGRMGRSPRSCVIVPSCRPFSHSIRCAVCPCPVNLWSSHETFERRAAYKRCRRNKRCADDRARCSRGILCGCYRL